MATQTASTRQPFAPLNHTRLANLTNLKNRQNAILTSPSSTTQKRKATTFDLDSLSSHDNSENIDPIIFLSPKRSKNPDGTPSSTLSKPAPINFFLQKSSTPTTFSSTPKPIPYARKILNTRASTPRIDTRKATPLSAPAGRSPTRKRVGILNRRKTAGPVFGRVEPPPRFGATVDGGLGFSIDAALSGTIPSYSSSRPSTTATPSSNLNNANINVNDGKLNDGALLQGMEAIPILHTDTAKESWFFSIHEDTEEELATNLMEHSTCILDLSSDEESRVRERDFRGKENIAPLDDVSQTRSVNSSSATGAVEQAEVRMDELKKRARREMGEIEVDREPLGALSAKDFYPEGCDEGSVFLVAVDETTVSSEEEEQSIPLPLTSEIEIDLSMDKGKGIDVGVQETIVEESITREEERLEIDALMSKDSSEPMVAALLQPIEKAEEGWSVWESGSADGGDS